MKREIAIIVIGLTLLLTVTALAGTMSGMVADVTNEGFILHTEEEVIQVETSQNTVWDTDGEIEPGDAVVVNLDENSNADRVTCYRLSGIVSEIVDADEPYLLLIPDDNTEPVRVNLDCAQLYSVASGIRMTIWYDGMMTRSIPPQITAQYIRGIVLEGTVTDIGENGEIWLNKDDGETVIVHCPDDIWYLAEPEIGQKIRVSVLPQVRLSIPAQYEAQDILPMNEEKVRE